MYGMDVKSKSSGFFKSAKKTYPMYPLREEKLKWDDYGEAVKEEDFKFADNPAAGLGMGGDDAVAKDNDAAGNRHSITLH